VRLDRAAEFYTAIAAWRAHHPTPPQNAELEITPALPPIPEPRSAHPQAHLGVIT